MAAGALRMMPIKENLAKILGQDAYNELAEVVEGARQETIVHCIQESESKVERRIDEVKGGLEGKIDILDRKIDAVQTNLKLEIAQSKHEILRWIFTFGVTGTISLAGLIIGAAAWVAEHR